MACIYSLADPRELEHVRYVGMSMNFRRPYSHVKESSKAKKTSYLYNWIRSLLSEGVEPAVSIVETFPTGTNRAEVCGREKHYIKHFRELGFRLTNKTEGGDGGAHDAETLARISASLTGRKPSAETLAKRSAALKGLIKSEETRRKLSIAHRGKKASDEVRRKLSAAHTGIPLSTEHRQRISEANKGKRVGGVTKQTEEAKAKISAKLKGVPKSEETRARMSAAQFKRYNG